MKPTLTSFPHAPVSQPSQEQGGLSLLPGAEGGALFRRGTVSEVVGTVQRIDLGWGGRFRLVLALSLGTLVMQGTRRFLEAGLDVGQRVRVRFLCRHGAGDEPTPGATACVRLLKATAAADDQGCSWVPTTETPRTAHVRQLREGLALLSPLAQGLFMAVMLNPHIQRRFFQRVAAADHHGYPGGLLDQSVCAACNAADEPELGPEERDLLVLAAVFFDLGKAYDPRLAPDRPRLEDPGQPLLAPHPMTHRVLRIALQGFALRHTPLAQDLMSLLQPAPPNEAARLASLRGRLIRAVVASWGGLSSPT